MSDSKINKISPKNLKFGDLILDVRTDKEIAQKALAIPFIHEDSFTIDIDDCIKKYNLSEHQVLNILCEGGKRATDVAKKFMEKGYNNVRVIEGGIIQAEKDGVKIIKSNI